ncbi:NUDIX domain-containing protein [Candidatus Woesearchaeota archaeon]|nr:NUDIX domain-containing protein [Candidatus Woesearchaeota archaeon]
MEHEIRNDILRKLMHNPEMKFHELWDKETIRSNKFAYHLKLMVEANLIHKMGEDYKLTQQGKSLVTFLDGLTGKKEEQPLTTLVMVVYDDGKILAHKRLKEPFYGYYGFPSGKAKFGEQLIEGAKRELMEETNLDADFNVKGMINCRTFNEDKIIYHHNLIILKGINPKGKLKQKDREGTFEWMTEDEFLKQKYIQNDPFILSSLKSEKFFLTEMDRILENGEFKEIKINENLIF